MVLLKKIFIIILFLFPLGEIIRLDFGNGIVAKPLDLGVSLFVALWLIIKLKNREGIRQKYILTSVLLFSGIGGLSLLMNSYYLTFSQFLASLLYLIRWIAYAGILFVISDFDKTFKKRIISLLIIVGSIIIGLGYFQYFFYTSLKGLLYLGWDEHMYRMFSVFLDPNFAGAFFVLFFLFIANIFLKKRNIPTGVLLLLTLPAVFLTFSRSALIMLILGSSLLFILMNKRMLILLILGITILVLIISSRYYNIENINLFRTISTKARLETSSNALRIIKDHPILGVGFNAYKYTQIRYGFRLDVNVVKSHADAGVDNSFLFVLATTGIIGFTAYMFLWYRVIKRYWFSVLIISSIFGLFVNSLFINSLFYPPLMFWIWVTLGTTEKN